MAQSWYEEECAEEPADTDYFNAASMVAFTCDAFGALLPMRHPLPFRLRGPMAQLAVGAPLRSGG